jgi:hypothetical protein
LQLIEYGRPEASKMLLKEVITIKKIMVGIIVIVLTSIFMIGCNSLKSPQGLPKLTITIEDKELEYVIAKNKWNNSIYDREDTFQTILKKGSKFEIPYIEIGKTVMINFQSYPPDKFTIADILIDENGKRMYSNKEVINIPVKLKDGKCSFEIKKHFASALSSVYVENKVDVRGFRMIASWGDNECEYAFVIKADGL